MRATIMHAPGDVRVDQTPRPTVQHPTDAVIQVVPADVLLPKPLWYVGQTCLRRTSVWVERTLSTSITGGLLTST